MFLQIQELNIHYQVAGQGQTIILLHGWGAQLQSFQPVYDYLIPYFRVYAIDLPGFGQSEPPHTIWDTQAYTICIQQFIQQLAIDNPIIIGHSFGGRIAIRLATTTLKIPKLILVDSAGIKPKRTIGYYIKIYLFKLIKKILTLPGLNTIFHSWIERAKRKLGSTDYQNAQGIMRDILINVVNEDLTPLLAKITAPTLLIWGEQDKATPVSDGEQMAQLIPNAGLVILKNAGHFSYLDKLNEFLLIIDNFLQAEKSS